MWSCKDEFCLRNCIIIGVSLIFVRETTSADVTGFEIAIGGTNLIPLEKGSSATINLVYDSGGTGLVFGAALNVGTSFNTSSAVKDEVAQTISFSLDETHMETLSFGTYLLTLNLTPTSGSSATKEVILFYEEPIIGFAIYRYPYAPLNEEVHFNVTFTNASNVETEWFLDTNDTYLLRHDGQPRSFLQNFTFTVPGDHNVTVVAANTVTRTFDSMIVSAYYRLNGFDITTENRTVDPLDPVIFNVTLSPTADLPMGSLKLNLSYGDGTDENINLDSVMSNLQGSGHTVQHYYSQGYYDVTATIYSEIDSVNFTMRVSVWENVTLSMSSVEISAVKEEITFNFLNSPFSATLYLIDFGDGNTVSNNVTDWTQAYETIILSHAYITDGIFNVTMRAWNPEYSSHSSYLITVQHPIPSENITVTAVRDTIPIPNGLLELSLLLKEDNPSPTDVLCTFNFVDETIFNISTSIIYNVPVTQYYTYNSTGSRTVSIDCQNLVSTMRKDVMVDVFFMLNGFDVLASEGTVGTNEQALFSVQLSPNANLSMGTLNMNISYGDGSSSKYVSVDSTIESEMQAGGHNISYGYGTQGNYSFVLSIYSQIDSINFTLDVYIWDIVNVSLTSDTIAKVNDPITFEFVNPPSSGFKYDIDYGDGDSKSNLESAWYSMYSEIPWDKSYSTEGVYTVTMTASNAVYSSSSTYQITVQHPILDADVTLTPASDIIPLPDGKVDFELAFSGSNPHPTNLSCSLDYNEGDIVNMTNVVFPISTSKEYIISSEKAVKFTCWNLVSNVTKSSSISVRSFTLQDFNVTYASPVAINSTVGSTKDDTYPHLTHVFKVNDKPSDVLFQIDLLNCSRMPPNITFSWNFGDNSVVEEDIITTKEKTHQYAERGNYTIELIISDGTIQDTRHYNLTMGIVQIEINQTEGVINDTIFEIKISGSDNFVFDTSANHKTLVSSSGSTYTVKYSRWGVFHECVTADHSGVIESVCIQTPIEIDFNLTNTLAVEVGNVNVSLPPGDVNISISTSGDIVKPYVNCTIDIKDPINTAVLNEIFNVSNTSPYLVTNQYKSLGSYEIEVICTNLVTSFNDTIAVDVLNDCFEPGGIFDRAYTDPLTPMSAYTSSDLDLSNRMQVNCDDILFLWTVKRVVEPVADPPVETNTLLTDNSGGTLRIPRGNVSQGLASVTLAVSSVSPVTTLTETMYVRFTKLPPEAFIAGGKKRSVRFNNVFVIINAREGSYDSEKGYFGDKSGLVFQWECYKVVANDLEEIESLFNAGSYGSETCNLAPTSDAGNWTLDLSQGIDTQGYIVTATVVDGDLNTSYTQFLKSIPGDPPDISIVCSINCLKKTAITNMINIITQCSQCTRQVVYSWRLFNADSNVEDTDFSSKTLTGLGLASVVIKANTLEPDRRYSLKLTARYADSTVETFQTHEFLTNFPPYNGRCQSNANEYKAPLEMVDITCEDWLDEGSYSTRDETRDRANKEPLRYKYETKTMRKDAQNVTEVVSATLDEGGEASAMGKAVQMGDIIFNYVVQVWVYVYDYYGDSNSTYFSITVRPDDAVSGTPDPEAVKQMFSKFDDVVEKTLKGGNAMAAVGLCGSMASVLGPPDSTSSGDTSNSTESVDDLYKNKTKGLSNTLKDSVVNTRTLGLLKASDAQKISRNLEAIVSNPGYISDEVTLNGANVSEKIIEKVRSLTETIPFPVGEIQSIEESVSGTAASVDKILGNLMPDVIVDVNENFTVDSLYDQLLLDEADTIAQMRASDNYTEDDITAYEESLRNQSVELYDQKIQQRETMLAKANSANDSVPLLMNSIGSIYDVKLKLTEVGANRSEIIRDSMKVAVEKVTLDMLTERNGTEEPLGGVKLGFLLNGTGSGNDISIKQSVFEKPPYIGGGNVGSLTSKAIQIDVSDEDIVPEASIPNSNIVHARVITPTYTSGDPEGMFYIRYEIRNDDDSTMIYLKPDDLDPSGSGGTLYHLYLQLDVLPTTASNLFNQLLSLADWDDDYGLKVIIPSMPKGKYYIGFKPQEVIVAKKRRRKRSATALTTTPATNSSVQTGSNVSLVMTTTGCRSWDDAQQSWVSNGCQVLPFSTVNETVCRCPRQSGGIVFATTFYTAPNTIDFSTVFSKFDLSNASVYGTCLGIIVIWIIAVVLLRRQDKKDQEKWAIHFLSDGDCKDSYFYMITVETGMRRGGGTKSNVSFVLTGDDGDTGVRALDDGIRKGFPSGSARRFFMGTKTPLGPLTYLRIWHDNSGNMSEQSWFLNQVIVDDPQERQRYVFLCDRWMALEEDDGQIERVIPLSGKENITTFNTLFFQHAQFNITENHLWLSLLMRPKRSSFTRVQRASCILALLFLTMISNAMFFRSSDDNASADTVSMGGLKFSFSIFFVSIIGILITTPPIVIVTMIFKKCKPKPIKTKVKPSSDGTTAPVNQSSKDFNGEDLVASDHLTLPYWTAYIAWVIIGLAVISSAFFLLLYSMQWGSSKSEEWLSSFVFSFVESLFCVDPLKVVVLAMVFSILFKRPVEDEIPKVDVEKLKEASIVVNDGSTREETSCYMNEFLGSTKPSPKELERLKVRRQQELRASGVLVELIIYSILVFCVFGISYNNRDDRSYDMKEYIDNSLYYTGSGQTGFESVDSLDKWSLWLTSTFIPAFFPETEYNGDALGARERLYFGDITNVRVGPARLRQVRMKNDTCDYTDLTWPYPCVNSYSVFSEDEGDYCVRWTPYGGSTCASPTAVQQDKSLLAWSYTDASDIWGIPITGEYGTYGGGGYLLQFIEDGSSSQTMLERLLQNNWIDRGTRAVFLEFTVYTANVNLFLYGQFLTEFTEIGGAFTYHYVQAFRPVDSLGGMGAFSLVCYAVFIIYIIYMTVRPILKIKKDGCRKFFKDIWNWIDLVCAILSYSLIAVFGVRLNYAKQAMAKYYEELAKPNSEKDIINFQHIVVWDNVFNIILGILVFIITLRVLRILGYNRRLQEVSSVVSHASTELIGFVIVFGIIFSAYISLGFLLFTTIEEYKSLFAAWGSLTNTLIGKNSFDKMVAVSPNMAQFYYFTFVFCVLMSLATMFAAILNKSISEIKDQTKQAEDEFGILDFLIKMLKSIVGIAYNPTSKPIQEPNPKAIYRGRNRGRRRKPKKRVTYKPFDDV